MQAHRMKQAFRGIFIMGPRLRPHYAKVRFGEFRSPDFTSTRQDRSKPDSHCKATDQCDHEPGNDAAKPPHAKDIYLNARMIQGKPTSRRRGERQHNSSFCQSRKRDRRVASDVRHSNLNPLNPGISAMVHNAAIPVAIDVADPHFVRVMH